MNRELTDSEHLELTARRGALADHCLDSAGRERRNHLLRTSGEARQFYLRHAALSASLFSYAAELQCDAPAPMPVRKTTIPRMAWWAAAVAALVVIAGFVHLKPGAEPAKPEAPSTENAVVALMSGTKD